ncbi:MAG: thioredoxin domain-containing protein [Gemmataceae bacterium]
MSRTSPPANRLIHESSPYLRQHAHNPVDWFPWGSEALQQARRLDRPIFLSIGYAACHWCHVMEHESFEHPDIARVLNAHFINIKVDREERPDLDHIYMTAVQLLTGQGGWPMSVFLTPDLKPFYGGTYFPPDDRYGRPGFLRLITFLAEAWRERRAELLDHSQKLTAHLCDVSHFQPQPNDLEPRLLRQTVTMLRRAYDSVHGGFGTAPKFPHPIELRLLLRVGKRFGDEAALAMTRHTLDRMAQGGIYDHLGGGFHRYSTDSRWLVPHFEKMLYDNALLSIAYLEAYQVTEEPFYRQVVEETLAYVLREMTSPDGAFYSTQDADSEGVEGKFYVWSETEIHDVLGKELASLFCDVYDVTAEGNWEGHNILNRSKTDEQHARLLHLDVAELRQRLAEARRRLLEVRGRRVWPGLDDKILTSWNALLIAALAQAGPVLEQPRYTEAASRAAAFVLERMRTADGRLLRVCGAGGAAKLNAYLEDYAYFIDSLVSLYEATFVPRWLQAALDLAEIMVDQFWDADEGGFFYTPREHEQLILRVKDMHDSSIPSSNGMAVMGLLRLAKLTGRLDLLEKAEATLRGCAGLMASSPLAAGQMLMALDFHLGPVREFAVVGDADAEETREALRLIRAGFQPHKVLALKSGDHADADELLPLLAGKTSAGPVTTYICQNFTCQEPVVGVAALRAALARREVETSI